MQKCTTSFKVGSIESNWFADRSMEKKICQDQCRPGWINSEQHENNKTTLIVGGIVLGLTALIIYEIY